ALTAQGQLLNFDTGANQQNTEKELQRMQLQAQYDAAQKAGDRALMSSLLSAGAALGVTLLSDRRAKTEIRKESDRDVDDFLGALEAYSYRYKEPGSPGAAEGTQHGPMAQDLEKSAIGRSVVRTGPDGAKRVDTDRLTLALAGVLARVAKEARMTKG